MFTDIQIQTIHKCNLKCSFCPNSYIKQSEEIILKEDTYVYDICVNPPTLKFL